MSKQPWQWTEDDILAIVRENQPENLTLDYKAAGSLAKTDGKKTEISKDVSAMANSAGGTLVYGIDEQKAQGGPLKLNPIDPKAISPEWLEQIIDANIQRRIPGLRVTPVQIAGAGQVVYVVSVPQSNLAPHMAVDHRYYKRLGTTTAAMEEYEVRDVSRRSESPDLIVTFNLLNAPSVGGLMVIPEIENHNPEPAFYATIRLYLPKSVIKGERVSSISPEWNETGIVNLLWEDHSFEFVGHRFSWGVQNRPPLLEGEKHQLGRFSFKLNHESAETTLLVGLELRAPKMQTKLIAYRLVFGINGFFQRTVERLRHPVE